MGENRTVVITNFPDGSVRSVIANGRHWISVQDANEQEDRAVAQAHKRWATGDRGPLSKPDLPESVPSGLVDRLMEKEK